MKTANEIGEQILMRLAAQAAANRMAASELRDEIRAVMLAHQGTERLTAKRVLAKLTRGPLPSIRTIQEHMQIIRSRLCGRRGRP
jgi:hypothetical protein